MTETFSAGGKIESLKLAASEAVKPPAGMIEIEGVLRMRRAGFARRQELRCWHNHHLPREESGIWPMEAVIRCGHCDTRNSPSCKARLYVLLIRSPLYFAMDVNTDEHNAIEFRGMSLDDLIMWFGITLPPPVKW